MSQITFASNATPTLPNLDANFTELYGLLPLVPILNDGKYNFVGSGTTLLTTSVPIQSGLGGGIVLIRGANSISGVAFVRAYVLAVRVPGGGAPDVAQTLIASAGDSGEVFTFGSTGTFVTVVGSGTVPANFYVRFIGF